MSGGDNRTERIEDDYPARSRIEKPSDETHTNSRFPRRNWWASKRDGYGEKAP